MSFDLSRLWRVTAIDSAPHPVRDLGGHVLRAFLHRMADPTGVGVWHEYFLLFPNAVSERHVRELFGDCFAHADGEGHGIVWMLALHNREYEILLGYHVMRYGRRAIEEVS